MRADYEARISALERRLEATEEKSAQPVVSAVEPVTANASAGSNAFNPAMSVIFLGQALAYGNDPEAYFIPGFPLGGESRPAAEGFSLGETEIDISANVDDKFTAWLTVQREPSSSRALRN